MEIPEMLWDALRTAGGVGLFLLGCVVQHYMDDRTDQAYKDGLRDGYRKGKGL